MKDKGFTLVELIVVIAVLSLIMLIGVPAFASIVERIRVRSDRVSATEIGEAIVIREVDVEREKQLPYYPVITRYDKIESINNYIAPTHRPQSMSDGYYFATALQIDGAKRILVGIGKKEMPVTNVAYNSPKASGWVYIQSGNINDFLEQNSGALNQEVEMPDNYKIENQENSEDNQEISGLEVGQFVKYKHNVASYSVTIGSSTSTFSPSSIEDWQIFSINGNTIGLISENSVGTLTLGGKSGYTDIVGALNDISRQFVDNKFIVSGRGLGTYSGQTGRIDGNIVTYANATTDSPYDDGTTYATDILTIVENEELWVDEEIWIGTRYVLKSEESATFGARTLPSNNRPTGYSLFVAKPGVNGDDFPAKTFGVRPIIYLSSDAQLGNGNGSKGNEYKLSLKSEEN